MIQNSSMFSVSDESENKSSRRLLISKNYEDIKFSKKALPVCGEVEVIKDFHIEISSNGETTILEYSRGEILDLVRNFFKKQIHLGISPSGFYIVSDINGDFFKVLES